MRPSRPRRRSWSTHRRRGGRRRWPWLRRESRCRCPLGQTSSRHLVRCTTSRLASERAAACTAARATARPGWWHLLRCAAAGWGCGQPTARHGPTWHPTPLRLHPLPQPATCTTFVGGRTLTPGSCGCGTIGATRSRARARQWRRRLGLAVVLQALAAAGLPRRRRHPATPTAVDCLVIGSGHALFPFRSTHQLRMLGFVASTLSCRWLGFTCKHPISRRCPVAAGR